MVMHAANENPFLTKIVTTFRDNIMYHLDCLSYLRYTSVVGRYVILLALPLGLLVKSLATIH